MTLDTLKKNAIKTAKSRGHKMGGWTDGYESRSSVCECTVCDAWVQVETEPAPNSIDIGGPAIAVNCADGIKRIYKTFKDCLGTPVKLEAKPIGMYTDTDDKSKIFKVWKPITSGWFGLYHLEPINGGNPVYKVVGLSTYFTPDGSDPIIHWENSLTPITD